MQELRFRAEQGDMQAQYALAMKYVYADGVEEDYSMAVTLLEQAAEQGHREAAYNLAICYHYGHGVEVDLKTAYQLYLRSALQGYGKGFNLVGDFYAQGLCVRQSWREAIKWYLDASVSEDLAAAGYAEYQLGRCLAYGLGVEPEPEKAVEWFERAESHGELRARAELERLGYYAAYRIREVRAEDAEAIWKLNRSYVNSKCTLEHTAQQLQKSLERPYERLYAAVREGKLVGYVHAADRETLFFEPAKTILGLVVEEEHRCMGIGTALLQKVELWAAETDTSEIVLEMIAGEAITKFLGRCGYEICNNIKQFRNQTKQGEHTCRE